MADCGAFAASRRLKPAAPCSIHYSSINTKVASAKRPSHFQRRSPWLAVWQISRKRFGFGRSRWRKLSTLEYSLRYNLKRRSAFRTALFRSSKIITTGDANRNSKLNQPLAQVASYAISEYPPCGQTDDDSAAAHSRMANPVRRAEALRYCPNSQHSRSHIQPR